jgi:hypothetical protein
MILTLSLVTLLAADPVHVFCNPRPGAEAVAPEVCERVTAELERSGLVPVGAVETRKRLTLKDTCRKTECYAQLATQLGSEVTLVIADVGKVGKLVAVHIEAVRSGAEGRLAFGDVSSAVGAYDPVNTVARQVSETLARLRAPVVIADVPPAASPPVLEPKEPKPSPVLTQRPMAAGVPLWVPIATGAAALVCAGLSLVFGISTLSQRSALDARRDPMTMVVLEPGSQVLSRVNGINTSATWSLSLGIGAGVLTAAAIGLATQVAPAPGR